MTIRDLYQKYQIMPQLETHMLRVAGVGKIIAENWKGVCNVKLVTELCLLHDMGNIVKFGLKDEDIEKKMFGTKIDLNYWRGVQKEYLDKYGHDANDATKGILSEAGLEKFNKFIDEEHKLYFAEPREEQLAKASIASVILMYADCKVKPEGVVSYRERIDDLRERYGGVKTPTWYDWTFWFEEWMQSKVRIDLSLINDAVVEPLFDELLKYQI